MEYATIAAVLALAGAVHGAAGFGFALVALGLLGGTIDIKEASILLVIGGVVLTGTIVWRLARYIDWKDVLPVMAAAAVGAPVGVLCLARMDAGLMRALVGVILLAATAQAAVPRWAGRPWHRLWLGIPVGLLCGVLSGAFATGGPPVVAHFASGRRDRRRFSVSVQLVLLTSGLVRLSELLRRGLLTPRLAALGAVGAAAAMAGALLGLLVLRRMSDTLLRRIVIALLFALGAAHLLAAVGVF